MSSKSSPLFASYTVLANLHSSIIAEHALEGHSKWENRIWKMRKELAKSEDIAHHIATQALSQKISDISFYNGVCDKMSTSIYII